MGQLAFDNLSLHWQWGVLTEINDRVVDNADQHQTTHKCWLMLLYSVSLKTNP